jgi:transcriptional regulator with XRE-family HTH domain
MQVKEVALTTSLTFANALKNRRAELGQTTRDAADGAKTSHATISRWESGRMIPTDPEQIINVADYLGITREEVVALLAESTRRNILADLFRYDGRNPLEESPEA